MLVEQIFDESRMSAIGSYLDEFSTPLVVFAISLIALRFIYGVARKEIQSFEDFGSFIVMKGVTFTFAFLLLMPISLPVLGGVHIGIDTEGLPTAVWMFKELGKVAMNSADDLAGRMYGSDVNFLTLGATFREQMENSVNNLKSTLESVRASNEGLPPEVARVAKKKSWLWTPLKAIAGMGLWLASGLMSGTGVSDLGKDMLADAFFTGEHAVVTAILNWVRDYITPASVILVYYGVVIAAFIKFAIYAPFFFFSVILLFFDKARDTVYQNGIKAFALLLYPLGIVIAFGVCKAGYVIYRAFFQDMLLDAVNSNATSFCVKMFVGLASAGLYGGVAVGVFRTIHGFIQNMLGQVFHVGLDIKPTV